MDEQPAGIACIACSWGGLRALQVVLGGLPAEFPWPICVVQHRGASSDEHLLTRLLRAATPLEVVDPEDKTPLQAGSVFLAPPGYHLLVEDGHLALSTEELVRWSRPSADVLLESAALAYGARCIAVVLTGANDDGARGAAAVHAAGGTVIIQDPGEAERPEMPRAAMAAVPAALVHPLAAVPSVLERIVMGDCAA